MFLNASVILYVFKVSAISLSVLFEENYWKDVNQGEKYNKGGNSQHLLLLGLLAEIKCKTSST